MYIVGSFQIVQYQAESTVNQELNSDGVNRHALNNTYTRKYLANHKTFKAKINGEVDYYNKVFAGAFLVNNNAADITVKSINGSLHIDKMKIYKKN